MGLVDKIRPGGSRASFLIDGTSGEFSASKVPIILVPSTCCRYLRDCLVSFQKQNCNRSIYDLGLDANAS